MSRRLPLTMTGSLLALAACTGTIGPDPGSPSGPPAAGEPPAGECSIEAVLERNACTTCHDTTPGITGGGLDLLSEGLTARLLNQPSGNPDCADDRLVDGALPAASILLRAIDPEGFAAHGSSDCAPQRMPLNSERTVSSDDVRCVQAWVESVADGGAVETPAPFDVAPLEAAVAKVKMLLHGGAVTDEELALAGSDGALDPAGLRTLIDRWVWTEPGQLTPEFDAKLEGFLTLALQQRDPGGSATFKYQSQLFFRLKGDLPPPAVNPRLAQPNFQGHFVDAARDLFAERRDFREVVTTRRWRVTTGLLAALVHTDDPNLHDDRGRFAEMDKFGRFAHFEEGDFSDWRTVTIEQATESAPPTHVYENTAELAASLRAIPEGGSLRLRVPRVGFFTTLVFLDNWETNPDNQFRVTASQVLIGALDLIFEASDTTPPASLAGLADDHAEVGTACYSCHQHLDPMRTVFDRYFTYGGRAAPSPSSEASTFAFHGHVVPEVPSMDAFAGAVASHPRFATAWAQKLCMWANAQRCSEADPEFQRVVAAFREGDDATSRDDDYRLSVLVRELFASPLVTGAAATDTHDDREFRVSATRFKHFCHGLNARFRQAAAQRCVDEELPAEACNPRTRGCGSWRQGQALGESGYARGARDLITPSGQDPVVAIAAREACRDRASDATQNDGPFPSGSDAAANVRRMVETIMGLPPSHSRHDVAVETLTGLHDRMREAGASRRDALRNVFVIACESPDLQGVGL